jgi:hypothetical protein
MKVVTNVMPIIFLSICNNYNEIYIDHGYILYKALHKAFINTLFPTLNKMLYVNCVASNSLLKHRSPSCMPCFSSSSAEQRPQSASFGGGKTDGSWRVLIRDCRKDKEEQIQNTEFCSKSRLVSSRTLKDPVSGILEEISNQSDMCRQ